MLTPRKQNESTVMMGVSIRIRGGGIHVLSEFHNNLHCLLGVQHQVVVIRRS